MKKKVLLIGWDAGDWKIIGPLLAKGQMPSLQKIIKQGVYGNMSTLNPPYSPMLWTSVATGKTADKHGILGFVEVLSDLSGIQGVTTNSRKSRALWNIFHNQGLKSNLVGWWPSFPAEPINGVIISDKFQKVSADPTKQSPIKQGTIHPKELTPEYRELRMFPWEITKQHILPFIPNAKNIDQEKDKSLISFSRVMAHNASVHNAATKVIRETEWDFTAVYYDFIDHMCHNFMKYHPPRLQGMPEGPFAMYNGVIEGAYRYQDMMLGRMLQLVDDNTTVIVMSDHGYESGTKRLLKMPKVQASPAMEHRQFGMFAACGPNINKNKKVYGLGLLDIAPTILHHFDLPVGRDMDGRVIDEMFTKSNPIKYIDSWEDMPGDFGELEKKESTNITTDEETLEQLVELGYIDAVDEKLDKAIVRVKSDLKHNLSRVYRGRKKFEAAKELLLELLEQKDKIDIGHYYIDLVKIALENKDYKEAEAFLEKFKTSESKLKLNTFFYEAEILAGNRRLKEARDLLEKEVPKRNLNSELRYKLGSVKVGLNQYKEAIQDFEVAIAIEPDKAKYHKGMADAYYGLGQYEETIDYAITSIELVNNYPKAHYLLGQALEKIGDLEQAKLAYETADKLKLRNDDGRAKIATENMEELLKLPKENEGDKVYTYRKDQITIVSGLPRSGTSLMMQMLSKGGSSVLTDKKRKADTSNPKGYLEYEPVMRLHKDNSWLGEAKNKSLKVVAPLLKFLDPKYRYKIIFMTRDLNEVIRSQQTMIGKDPNSIPLRLLNSYQDLLKGVQTWKDKEPGVEMIFVNYKDALEDTETVVNKVSNFIGKDDLNKKAMIACVDKKLYRNRS